jgi:hypothetical protein
MAENNLDKAIAYLGTQISSLVDAAKSPIDTDNLHTLLAKRSLTGDHINGGMILNFASKGIKDEANSQQLLVNDSGIKVSTLTVDTIKGNVSFDSITASTIKVDVLEVKELKTDIQLEKSSSLEFKGDAIYGKGLIWSGQGYTKQFIFAKPDKFFSTEHIELSKDKAYFIDNNPVLSATELGLSVTKSNIRSLGRLQGLIVDGNVSIGQYLYFNAVTSRLGFGTEEPNAAMSIAENGVEVLIGTSDDNKGIIGTFASSPFDIVTDNIPRVSIAAAGNILLGNRTQSPIEVAVHGKLGVNVRTIDSRVDLHVAGAIKFNDKLQLSAASAPDGGTYNRGDIVWNSEPDFGKCIGWVCIRAGSPGAWAPFGEIKNAG